MSESTRRTVRTVVQVLIGLVVAAPVLVAELGLSPTVRWVAVLLAVCAAITRVMQVPAVDDLLTRLGIGKQSSGRHVAGRPDVRAVQNHD